MGVRRRAEGGRLQKLAGSKDRGQPPLPKSVCDGHLFNLPFHWRRRRK